MTREEVYAAVWSGPLHRVAPLLGMSDVGLKQFCRRHNIPLPPPGYWRKPAAAARSPYHDVIVSAITAGLAAPQIVARLRPLGYRGSVRAIRKYLESVKTGSKPPLPPGSEVVRRSGRSFRKRLSALKALV